MSGKNATTTRPPAKVPPAFVTGAALAHHGLSDCAKLVYGLIHTLASSAAADGACRASNAQLAAWLDKSSVTPVKDALRDLCRLGFLTRTGDGLDRELRVGGLRAVRTGPEEPEDLGGNPTGRESARAEIRPAPGRDSALPPGGNPPPTRQGVKQGARREVGRRAGRVADNPPQLDELVAYALEHRGTREQAEAFLNHFTSNGWKVGKAATPMVSWQAGLSGWIGRDRAGMAPRTAPAGAARRREADPGYNPEKYSRGGGP